jgi:hypothetical protein
MGEKVYAVYFLLSHPSAAAQDDLKEKSLEKNILSDCSLDTFSLKRYAK